MRLKYVLLVLIPEVRFLVIKEQTELDGPRVGSSS